MIEWLGRHLTASQGKPTTSVDGHLIQVCLQWDKSGCSNQVIMLNIVLKLSKTVFHYGIDLAFHTTFQRRCLFISRPSVVQHSSFIAKWDLQSLQAKGK